MRNNLKIIKKCLISLRSVEQIKLRLDHLKVFLVDVPTASFLHQPNLLFLSFQFFFMFLRLELKKKSFFLLVAAAG